MTDEGRLYDFSVLTQNQPADKEFIKNMLSLFLTSMPVTNTNLVQACKEHNWEEVHFNAHKMKAGIDTFNVTELKPVVRRVEKNAKNVNEAGMEAIQNDVQLIDQYLKRCLEAMQQEVETL